MTDCHVSALVVVGLNSVLARWYPDLSRYYPLGPLVLDTRALGNVAPELAEPAPRFACLELTMCFAPDPSFLLTVELGCLLWAPTWL